METTHGLANGKSINVFRSLILAIGCWALILAVLAFPTVLGL